MLATSNGGFQVILSSPPAPLLSGTQSRGSCVRCKIWLGAPAPPSSYIHPCSVAGSDFLCGAPEGSAVGRTWCCARPGVTHRIVLALRLRRYDGLAADHSGHLRWFNRPRKLGVLSSLCCPRQATRPLESTASHSALSRRIVVVAGLVVLKESERAREQGCNPTLQWFECIHVSGLRWIAAPSLLLFACCAHQWV